MPRLLVAATPSQSSSSARPRALVNVQKQAQPTVITVSFRDHAGVLTGEIQDDGRGADIVEAKTRPERLDKRQLVIGGQRGRSARVPSGMRVRGHGGSGPVEPWMRSTAA
jgi:nitrate/nitrite-specific signal transduction histidine kinase